MASAAYIRRDYSGTAVETTLSAGINASVETFSITSSSGWPTGANGPFFAVIESEVIDCLSRSGTTVTVVSGGRGANGTTAATHASGVAAKHVFTAYEANEANLAVAKTILKATGVGQMLLTDAANSFAALSVKDDGKIIVGNGTSATSVAVSGDITLTNAGVTAIASGVIVNGDINASAAIALTKLATIADARILGNNTGGASVPVALTAAQVKTLLAVLSTDLSDFAEAVADTAGAMFTGNTETGVTVTYQDGDNTIDVVVGVDGSTTEVNGSNQVGVKAAGIGDTQLAASLPRGWVAASTPRTSAQNGIGDATDITGSSITVNLTANRKYVYTPESMSYQVNGAGDKWDWALLLDGTRIGTVGSGSSGSGQDTGVAGGSVEFTTTTASHTLKVQLVAVSASSTVNMTASATAPIKAHITDIGGT